MTKPIVFLSYSWLLRHVKNYTDEELATGLFLTGAALEHIINDSNFDARYAEEAGCSTQSRVKSFILKANEEGRYRRTLTADDFNAVMCKFGVQVKSNDCGFINQSEMVEALEAKEFEVACHLSKNKRT